MRDLMIGLLVNAASPIEKFDRETSRWRDSYITQDQGLVRARTKKERGKLNKPIHVSDMTQENWEALDNKTLLWSYTMIVVISLRQM